MNPDNMSRTEALVWLACAVILAVLTIVFLFQGWRLTIG